MQSGENKNPISVKSVTPALFFVKITFFSHVHHSFKIRENLLSFLRAKHC